MNTLSGIFIFVCSAYVALILIYSNGITRLFKPRTKVVSFIKFSLLVPFRNEAHNLNELIASINKLEYPKEHLELIFINDHSTDNSIEVIKKSLNQQFDFHLLELDQETTGKKAAIYNAVQEARHPYIACTDADCTLPPDWLNIQNIVFQLSACDFLAGLVVNEKKKGFLNSFLFYEQLSLSLSAAGSFGINQPTFCSAANMSFKKEVYPSKRELHPDLSSGDDVFLVHALKKRKKKLHFMVDERHLVKTKAMENISDAWNQKKRWAAKSIKYTDFFSILTAMLVYLCNSALTMLIALSLFNLAYLPLVFASFILKTSIDMLLFKAIRRFKQIPFSIIEMAATQFLFAIYVTIVAPFAIFGSFKWKGRRSKK